MRLPLFQKRSRESGYMVVTVLAGVVPLTILSSAMVMLMTTRTQHGNSRMADERLVASAEGAAQQGLAEVRVNKGISGLTIAPSEMQPATDGIDNDRDGHVDESDETGLAYVLTNWRSDQIDNDGDGRVDEDDENVYSVLIDGQRDQDGLDNDADGTIDEADENSMVTLVGVARPFANYAGARERRVTFWLQRSEAILPTPSSAVFLGDPNSEIKFNGTNFLISGNDSVSGISLPGIGVAGDPSNVLDALNNNQGTNVVGSGPSPSVAEVSAPAPWASGNEFINDMIETYSGAADFFLSPGTYTSAPAGSDGVDNDGDGTVDEADESWFGNPDTSQMAVTYAQGDLHFSGNNRGAGLLIVDGELRISGQFQWHGMVIVRGEMVLTGGGNTQKMILGAAYIGSNVEENVESSMTVGGNAAIQYSQYQLQTLSTELSSFQVWGFREG